MQTKPNIIHRNLKTAFNDKALMDEIEQRLDFSSKKKFIQGLEKDFSEHKSEISLEANHWLEAIDKGGISNELVAETIVLHVGRPSIIISKNNFPAPTSQVWRDRLKGHKQKITNTFKSVGRIELENHPNYHEIATGWLLGDEGLLVTNRHVAEAFVYQFNGNLTFKTGINYKKIVPYVDFLEEYRNPNELEFRIRDIVYVASSNEPDVAVFKVEPISNTGDTFPHGLDLYRGHVPNECFVYTVGYPMQDWSFPDPALKNKVFGNVYGVKRIALGSITNSQHYFYDYHHDCSTLGGCSGSPVIDINTGQVVGLHYAGRYRKYNVAVKSSYLVDLFMKLGIYY